MAFDTYANFKTEVEDWIDRPDLTSKIDSFITIAESTIRRRCKGLEREIRSQATVPAGDRYIALPSDYEAMRNLSIRPEDGGGYLEQVSADHMDRMTERYSGFANNSTPLYFAIHGNEIELYPVPGADVVLDMTHIETLTPLATAVNPVFTDHPDIYLFATLEAASIYMVEDNRVPMWISKLDRCIDEYNRDAEQKRYGNAPLVMRPTIRLTRRA